MSAQSKIKLSRLEMDLLNNSEWILTKNLIVKKAQLLLEQVQQNISDYAKQYSNVFPPEVIAISPKISKGENYRGLPWLILDYPRYFDRENIFAIRIMFWWANFFSTTLHLAGRYKQKYHMPILNCYNELVKNDFYTCVSDEQWQHHFDSENYMPIGDFTPDSFSDNIQKRAFIKLSQKLSFSEWENATTILSENFARIIKWLG